MKEGSEITYTIVTDPAGQTWRQAARTASMQRFAERTPSTLHATLREWSQTTEGKEIVQGIKHPEIVAALQRNGFM